MKLRYITVTGADDSIAPEDLMKLGDAYPKAEFGILLSKSQQGHTRFPSANWQNLLRELIIQHTVNEKVLPQFSGHLCGRWVIQLVEDGRYDFVKEIPLWTFFSRIQLNFHGEPHRITFKGIDALREICWSQKKEFIIQMDDVNNHHFAGLIYAGIVAHPLYDVSHGAGVLPEEWPVGIEGTASDITPHIFRGYAGGLSPENLARELPRINEVAGEDEIWIDAETRLRSNNDKQFDLQKVESFLTQGHMYGMDQM